MSRAALSLLAVLVVPRLAGAQPLVVPGDVDRAGVRALTAAARECGAAGPRAMERPRPEPPRAAREAIEAVSRARELTLDAEFEPAIAKLEALYEDLLREPERAGTGRIWAEALTVEAFARWSRAGGPDTVPVEVSAKLDEAVSLWPDVEVDASVMPPAVTRALEEARVRRRRRPSGEIAITDARGATWAWISGQPERARRVVRPAGRTLVVVTDAWGETRTRLIDVRPAERVSFSAGAPRRAPSASPPPGAQNAIVVGQGEEGFVAQQWPEGRARVDVARTAEGLAARLGLCDAAVAANPRSGVRAGSGHGGGPSAIWYVLGAAALVAGFVPAVLLVTNEPVAEIRLRNGSSGP